MVAQRSVLLVDDHQMFRTAIRSLIENEPDFQVVGEAASAEDALSLILNNPPFLIVVDLRLQRSSGIGLVRTVKTRWPTIKILILTAYDLDPYVNALCRIGIDGYVLKESPQEALIHALREITNGGVYLEPRITSKLMKVVAQAGPRSVRFGLDHLTMRELEILELVSAGLGNADIAQRLGIALKTVEAHMSSVLSKIGVAHRAQAVRVALQLGLIS